MFKIEYSGNFTAAMKEYTEEKVYSKLQSVASGAVKVVLTSLPDKKFDLEMSIDNKVRASSRGEDFYTLVIECTTKLFTQLTKYKKYLDKRNAVVVEEPEKLDQKILKEKVLIVEGMTQDEAIANMEILGHSFFIFRDIDFSNDITVLYKRHDQSYGVIRCR